MEASSSSSYSSWFRRSVSKLKITSLPSFTTANNNTKSSGAQKTKEEEEKKQLYGITEQLVEFIKSFSLDTFRNFSLSDEDENCGDSGNVRKDLSDWQETHAMLVLSTVKELAQLRFQLCPRYLKERQFWRIYFKLVRSYVTEYELRAVRLAKLKEMENGTVSKSSPYEVEMSEAKFTSVESETSVEQN